MSHWRRTRENSDHCRHPIARQSGRVPPDLSTQPGCSVGWSLASALADNTRAHKKPSRKHKLDFVDFLLFMCRNLPKVANTEVLLLYFRQADHVLCSHHTSCTVMAFCAPLYLLPPPTLVGWPTGGSYYNEECARCNGILYWMKGECSAAPFDPHIVHRFCSDGRLCSGSESNVCVGYVVTYFNMACARCNGEVVASSGACPQTIRHW